MLFNLDASQPTPLWPPNHMLAPPACRPYAEKAKWADPSVPVGYLRELFQRYVPPTLFELRKSFVHVVPLNTMNFVSTLCAILEVGG